MGSPPIRYARNGDVSIAYGVMGDGPLDLIYIPGFVSHLEDIWEWRQTPHFFERLASFSRLIMWDKREQGLSDRLGQPPTLEQGMEDLRCVLDAVGSERAALFGTSEGGPMACLFAASFPERVSHLVLYGSWSKLVGSDDNPAGVPRSAFEQWLDQTVANWGGPAALAQFAPSTRGDADAVAWWARFLRSASSPRAAKSLMEMYLDIDVRPHSLRSPPPRSSCTAPGTERCRWGWGGTRRG